MFFSIDEIAGVFLSLFFLTFPSPEFEEQDGLLQYMELQMTYAYDDKSEAEVQVETISALEFCIDGKFYNGADMLIECLQGQLGYGYAIMYSFSPVQ